eukprot:365303-Chlamydomonas_euryale.AAC.12
MQTTKPCKALQTIFGSGMDGRPEYYLFRVKPVQAVSNLRNPIRFPCMAPGLGCMHLTTCHAMEPPPTLGLHRPGRLGAEAAGDSTGKSGGRGCPSTRSQVNRAPGTKAVKACGGQGLPCHPKIGPGGPAAPLHTQQGNCNPPVASRPGPPWD